MGRVKEFTKIWTAHEVTTMHMSMSLEEGLCVVHETLEIVLGYVGLYPIVSTFIEVHLEKKLGLELGGRSLHGLTCTRYSEERKCMGSKIQLNMTSLPDVDALIATLLHELAHILHATTTGAVIATTMDRCGGHDDKFFAMNTMLLSVFKGDLRSRRLILDPNSSSYDVSRYLTFNYIPQPVPVQHEDNPPPPPTQSPSASPQEGTRKKSRRSANSTARRRMAKRLLQYHIM